MTSRRLVLLLALTGGALATRADAQGLRGRISDLFRFGDCGEPLCLAGSVNAANGHGLHFLPAVAAGNASMIAFLVDAVAVNVADVPIASASGGSTFAFENGVPVKTSVSAGPIFGERAQTLGRRRAVLTANVTAVRFTTLRGQPLRDLNFVFTHQDVTGNGLGDPPLENDFMAVRTRLALNLVVTTASFAYGITDHLDVAVALPYVHTTLDGTSTAQIHPFGATAVHLFGMTANNPQLSATSRVSGSADGIGDVALRVKANLVQSPRIGFSVLGDARLPTGDEENFLGSGATTIRGLAIASARLGSFGPHGNFGVIARQGRDRNDAILLNVGFDHLLSSWATLAVDYLSERQVGANRVTLPGPVHYTVPFARVVHPTEIPNSRDDLSNLSVGFKLTSERGFGFVANGLVPLDRGGLRADATWTFGVERNF